MSRHFTFGGVQNNAPEALALTMREFSSWKLPLDKCLIIAEAIWAEPDDFIFKWRCEMAVRQTPKGYCPTCGANFAQYIACENTECDWIDDPIKNVEITITHPNVNPVTQVWGTTVSKTETVDVSTIPADAWK